MSQQPGPIPTVIIDTREQTPLVFTRIPSTRGTLQTGDYSLSGCEEVFAVERKSVADLVSCCTGDNRDRFERELHRLRGYRFKRLLVIGRMDHVDQHLYRSKISPASVLGSLAAWEVRYDVPVVWCVDPDDAAARIERWAHYWCREITKQAEILQQSGAY